MKHGRALLRLSFSNNEQKSDYMLVTFFSSFNPCIKTRKQVNIFSLVFKKYHVILRIGKELFLCTDHFFSLSHSCIILVSVLFLSQVKSYSYVIFSVLPDFSRCSSVSSKSCTPTRKSPQLQCRRFVYE